LAAPTEVKLLRPHPSYWLYHRRVTGRFRARRQLHLARPPSVDQQLHSVTTQQPKKLNGLFFWIIIFGNVMFIFVYFQFLF
jgi:hypothetical protein